MARKKKDSDEGNAPKSTVETTKEEVIEETPQMTPEEQMQERIRNCNGEIAAVLQKYNCDLEASVLLRPGMVVPQIKIIPVEILQQEMQQRRQQPQQPANPIIQ